MTRPRYLNQTPRSSINNIAEAILTVLLFLVFASAGALKLFGPAPMVVMFDAIGFGQELRYVTAIVEIGCAMLLLPPKTRFYGAGLLGITMLVAVLVHLFIIGGSPLPAFGLAMLSFIVAWLRK